MAEISILIVEDEPIIAEDIAQVLERNDYKVHGIAYSAEDALTALEHPSDLVLLDINLNGIPEGIDLGFRLHHDYQIPFIYLSSYADRDTLSRAKTSAPYGYLVKPFSAAGLCSAIEIALYNFAQHQKQKFPELSLHQINQYLPQPLSDREFDLLTLIYEGNSNQQIASKLFISLNTVKKHINHAYLKLDTGSRSSCIARLRELMMKH